MNSPAYQNTKIWKKTLPVLKVLAVLRGKSMVHTLHSIVKAEAEKVGIKLPPQ